MESKKLSIREALAFGFYKTTKHIGLLIQVSLEAGLLYLCITAPLALLFYYMHPDILNMISSPESSLPSSPSSSIRLVYFKAVINLILCYPLEGAIGVLLLFLCIILYNFGWNHVSLDIYDHGKSNSTVFFSFRLLPKAFIAYCFYIIAVIVGITFLIIPGIIAYIRLGLFPFFIIDKKARPLKALTMSWHATEGHFWKLIVFLIIGLITDTVYMSIPIIGSLLRFFIAPVLGFAWAYSYRVLMSAKEIVENE